MPRVTIASAPTDAERRAFGDLAEDIAYLRRVCMLTVAPYHGEYRIGVGRADDDVIDGEGIRARATAERERRKPDPALARSQRQYAKVHAGRRGRR